MSAIERLWYRTSALTLPLLPLTLLFGAVASIRRGLFQAGWKQSVKLPVPVVVVGNITVGGAGKTPLTIALVAGLRQLGYRPGIISRGYGGQIRGIAAVTPASAPADVGDEPVLMAQRTGCPVFVGRDRAAAGRALLAEHPSCNILVCDDGLQHYRLQRDIELCVVDTARAFGNGLLLPAGPLREPYRRLRRVSAVVLNGQAEVATPASTPRFRMRLQGERFTNLADPALCASASHFQSMRVVAVAGIGNPQRFFDHLKRLGIEAECHAFPDHHAYAPSDLAFPDADAILLTEKDAVKCCGAKDARIWALPVSAEVEPDLAQFVADTLRKMHGPQAA
ncbi:tetraacyldisaccharide 4'-kinase [Chitinivorax sp. PXF-14]|uniref:tetraacyldisaccharide 4'-kinase n=1 Tax=Chitinivorax sp. PXF-14 TaxID=3230488 RepID=UPI003466F0FC